jgi:LysW-gamma-L-lysine carboxypeptidase
MLQIPSLSGAEQAIAEFLAGALAELGFDARLDEAGNVIGDIGAGGGPVIMLLSHMDTVGPQLAARRDEARLYG